MKELYPPPLNLHRLYAETQEWEPVLIIISPGADPSQELADLAAETMGRDSYHEVKKYYNFIRILVDYQVVQCMLKKRKTA